MESIFACALLFLSFAAEPALSIQCYNCTAFQLANPPEGFPPLSPAEMNCFDPFNTEGIPMIECAGKCYGEMATIQGDFSGTSVTRACHTSADGVCFPGCLNPNAGGTEVPPEGVSGGEVCRYCCDGELCNTMPIEETARAQAPPPVEGTRNCWKCEETKADATDGSCASDTFNGKGAEQVSCNGQCVLFMGPNEQGMDGVSRDCDSFNAICTQPGIPDGACCTGELCNGGNVQSGAGGGDGGDSGDGGDGGDGDDDDVEPIDCWACIDAIGSPCYEGMFTGETETITKRTCPTGKCVTLMNMITEDQSVFVRDCLDPLIGDGICEKDKSNNPLYEAFSEVKCCSKNLCNGAPAITSSLAAIIFSTLFVLVTKVLM